MRLMKMPLSPSAGFRYIFRTKPMKTNGESSELSVDLRITLGSKVEEFSASMSVSWKEEALSEEKNERKKEEKEEEEQQQQQQKQQVQEQQEQEQKQEQEEEKEEEVEEEQQQSQQQQEFYSHFIGDTSIKQSHQRRKKKL
ncbi:hypothetical protein ElyMa_000680600 [Elysia marginata]|uniref:Uncharacterized protein n=1 Tax=Elysia marginata TaxID=1093978 RepID=A0AAV4GH55_9GAST|nr:hypothetical protein ElyMa_000680600 [Elysia marginata]